MKTYICFYTKSSKKILVEAASSYEAQTIAAKLFHARKQYDVHVYLADQPINTASI